MNQEDKEFMEMMERLKRRKEYSMLNTITNKNKHYYRVILNDLGITQVEASKMLAKYKWLNS